MIVGCISSESRTLSGSPIQNPDIFRYRGFVVGAPVLAPSTMNRNFQLTDPYSIVWIQVLFPVVSRFFQYPNACNRRSGTSFCLSSVGFQFERKTLANNHAYMILAFIKKHAAYISAINGGALRRRWVNHFKTVVVDERVRLNLSHAVLTMELNWEFVLRISASWTL